jgi:pimeloyl-ACP methyl ester carboxylesterase
MNKHFIQVEGRQLCYRSVGQGPLLYLLHPCPRNGRMMEPLMRLLCDRFTCIAPDMAGYGGSDALPRRATAMDDYVPDLHRLITQLSGERPVVLYGTATGAQLAIAYALRYPQRVRQLYLDNCAHFEEAERDELLAHYFPDLSPREDGSHLLLLWQHVCNACLYFPWYQPSEAHRIAAALPPLAVLQETVQDYLLAGPHYADAYRAAFMHERAAQLQQLRVPAVLFQWLGSPLKRYMERLLQHHLPARVVVRPTPAGMGERYAVMQQIMFSLDD